MAVSKATQEFCDSRIDPLSKALQGAFDDLTADLDPRTVVGLGLLTDLDGDSLVVCVNTQAGFEAKLATYQGPEYADAVDDDFDWALYLRWYVGEWSRNDTDTPTSTTGEINRIWGELVEYRDSAPTKDRAYFPSLQFEVAALALGYLNEDGYFAQFPNSVRMISVGDEIGVADDVYRWGAWVNEPSNLPDLARYIAQESSDD